MVGIHVHWEIQCPAPYRLLLPIGHRVSLWLWEVHRVRATCSRAGGHFHLTLRVNKSIRSLIRPKTRGSGSQQGLAPRRQWNISRQHYTDQFREYWLPFLWHCLVTSPHSLGRLFERRQGGGMRVCSTRGLSRGH
jgi:hypothetical protein